MTDANFIHTLARVDVSTGKATLEDGATVDMLKLHLWVHQHGQSASTEAQALAPIWMTPATASVLIQGLNAKMQSAFSGQLQADSEASRKPQ